MDAISRLFGPQAALALFAFYPDAPFYASAAVTLKVTVLLALAAGRSRASSA